MNSAKDDTLELIRTFLPKYLTPELQENLFNTVNENFPLSINPNLIYSVLDNNYYQGDALVDIPFSNFDIDSFNMAYLSGILLSNSCDISPENVRLDNPNFQFATIFSLDEYLLLLEKGNIGEEKVQSFVQSLKSNRISNLFYLPEKKNGEEVIIKESFVRFDLNVTLPAAIFDSDRYSKDYAPIGDRLFSFTNYGFYLFLIKLSIHYCRFREGVFRNV